MLLPEIPNDYLTYCKINTIIFTPNITNEVTYGISCGGLSYIGLAGIIRWNIHLHLSMSLYLMSDKNKQLITKEQKSNIICKNEFKKYTDGL